MGTTSQERLTALFRQHSPRVLAYLLHRGAGEAAPDLLSETFAVAWRRIDDVAEEALPWLLVVARNVLAYHWRATGRVRALEQAWALDQRGEGVVGDVGEDVSERAQVRCALASLSRQDREVLVLVGWDALGTAEAAAVLGCSPGAFSVRLHRARRRLQQALDAAPHHRGPARARRPGRDPIPIATTHPPQTMELR